MSRKFSPPWDETNPTPDAAAGNGKTRNYHELVRELTEPQRQPWVDPHQTVVDSPREYRDPWLTGGWFAKLVQDHDPLAAKERVDFPSSGSRWIIAVILLVQAMLSIRLLTANTTFPDEGLYLFTGFLQVSHQIPLTQLTGLATWFSGSPEIYPPTGALAAHLGGVAGARLLSLGFMLFTTGALYAVTRRLWSSRLPAIFAAALFGWLGSVQFLGSFATYDAMALSLLALATWLGVRAAACRLPASAALLAAATICLLVANATKYMSTLYDPVVVAVIALQTWRVRQRTAALATGCAMAVGTAVLVVGAYWIAGSYYQYGIGFSTLTRAMSDTPPSQVLAASGRWIGVLVVVATGAAIAIGRRYRNRATTLLAWVLTAAALLVPIQEARIHTTVSLYKHVGFGAWFACAAAGWILAYAFDADNRGERAEETKRRLTPGRVIAILAVAGSAAIGVISSTTQFHNWPNSSAATTELTRLVHPQGEYLAEDFDQFTYYLRDDIPLAQWWNTWSFNYTDPKTNKELANTAAYAAAIRDRYFSVIVLDYQDTDTTDRAIQLDIDKYHDYRLAASIPFTTSAGPGRYLFWIPASR
jgi:hypothetical protein